MPDYSKGKIYTIRCRNDDTKIYVGSTIQSLAVRFGGHKKDSRRKNRMNKLLYVEVNGDWDNWYIELYENYPCSCREELHKKEGEVIRLIGTLNKLVAGRTHPEYREENRDILRDKGKIYYYNNIDKESERKRIFYENNKEKILEKQHRYIIENADKVKEQKRLYYLKTKEEKLKELGKATTENF
jgi:hypothetical protein